MKFELIHVEKAFYPLTVLCSVPQSSQRRTRPGAFCSAFRRPADSLAL
jgi:hypothetical protein